jgi:hypothetical protein
MKVWRGWSGGISASAELRMYSLIGTISTTYVLRKAVFLLAMAGSVQSRYSVLP